MNKLQSIAALIEALPVEEQRELVSMFAHVTDSRSDFFELTDTELGELGRRIENVNNEPTYTPEEVFTSLREKYVHSEVA
jgi:hypothetical protein